MKVYPKDKMYLTLPPLVEGQAGWIVDGQAFNREQVEAMNCEARGYERTRARLDASRARRKVEELREQ